MVYISTLTIVLSSYRFYRSRADRTTRHREPERRSKFLKRDWCEVPVRAIHDGAGRCGRISHEQSGELFEPERSVRTVIIVMRQFANVISLEQRL
jgi:hypothetical protein